PGVRTTHRSRLAQWCCPRLSRPGPGRSPVCCGRVPATVHPWRRPPTMPGKGPALGLPSPISAYPCQYVSFTLGMYHACCLGNPLGVNVFMGQFMPQGAAVPVLVATTFALLALVLLIMLLRTRRHYDHLLQEKHAVELELARL